MCTIAFAYDVYPEVVVASNRDEEYGRSFEPPARRDWGDGWVVAPVDRREGGTWLGFNGHGLVVTLANLPVYSVEETRSRGLLCRDVLGCGSVDEARGVVERSFVDHGYDGFNLVVLSRQDGFVAVHDTVDLELYEPSGFEVVTNSRFDEPDEKARKVREKLPDAGSAEGWLTEMQPVLRDHEADVCAHHDGRGTTSSNLVVVREPVEESSYRFADGAPCESEYEKLF